MLPASQILLVELIFGIYLVGGRRQDGRACYRRYFLSLHGTFSVWGFLLWGGRCIGQQVRHDPVFMEESKAGLISKWKAAQSDVSP
jgi:hypothetical protein